MTKVRAPRAAVVLARFVEGATLCDIARELGRKTVPPGLPERDAAWLILNYHAPCERALRRAVRDALRRAMLREERRRRR